MSVQPGKLVIVSGPSGSGKSTVVRRLLQDCRLPLTVSVSATTRSPRAGEVDGRDYYFLSREQFQQRRQAGDFLECMEVYGQHWYGTLRQEVRRGLEAGQWVVLEIDVNGAMEVLKEIPNAITIAVLPASMAELEQRLRDRGTDSEEAIQRRLRVASSEIQSLRSVYQHHITNDQLDRAVSEICAALQHHREKST